jgi:hypothetical protein
MKVIAAEVAARLGMQTRKAATESHATTGEMASAKAAAHMSAAESTAHMTSRILLHKSKQHPKFLGACK